ncbi:MAG: DUF1338 domain-containing protein [Bdellovibrionota bacterium]|nr:DUF1338 domain-containing protein [Bdellovibrionota bacterium]
MDLDKFFKKSWDDYIEITPSAKKINDLLKKEGEDIVNDHIALRTFSDDRVGLKVFEEYFCEQGYEKKGDYSFPEKKLRANHFENRGNPSLPKIFISELDLESFSTPFKDIVEKVLKYVPIGATFRELYNLTLPWKDQLIYEDYQVLRKESEYAAWLLAMGFRANHFTVFINPLKKLTSIRKMNDFLKGHGFSLNESGGDVKGSPEDFLEQSSIMADTQVVSFKEGEFDVSTCYYEFAQRYKLPSGEVFQGFIANSASKIFESTNLR